MMSEYNTKELLAKYQITAKKKWGQNFISDSQLTKKMVKLSLIASDTTVIEIGPGLGILTAALAEVAKKVIAFEIDKQLVSVLKERFKDEAKVEIVAADFLEVDLSEYLPKINSGKVVVCANLPYYITTPILFKLFDSPLDIQHLSVMLQKEVGKRFSATVNSKDYNALSVITAFKYSTKVIMQLPKEVFFPRPKVDSVVLLFSKKKETVMLDETALFQLVKTCFKYRRKTIYNNYREVLGDEAAKLILEKAEIGLNQRAQELSLAQYLQLYEVQCGYKSLRQD